jgi:hypothetical protein
MVFSIVPALPSAFVGTKNSCGPRLEYDATKPLTPSVAPTVKVLHPFAGDQMELGLGPLLPAEKMNSLLDDEMIESMLRVAKS